MTNNKSLYFFQYKFNILTVKVIGVNTNSEINTHVARRVNTYSLDGIRVHVLD